MLDIAYGFPGVTYKNARKTIKVYALVFVCLISGATNILALEDGSTWLLDAKEKANCFASCFESKNKMAEEK